MERRVRIKWTLTARDSLATLPKKVRRAIIDKVGALANCDPRKAHKPLEGPLAGYFAIKVSRYRAIYTVRDEKLPNGDVLIHVHVTVVAVGMRKDGDKQDVYRLAERLIRYAGQRVDPIE